LVKDPGVNAGRVFYQDGKLNVIFGELQSNYRKKNIYGQRTEDFTPRREGSRAKASKQKFSLAAAPGIEFHAVSSGAARNDWVMIDPAVASAQMVAQPASTGAVPQQATTAPPPMEPSPASSAASAPAATAAQAPAASAAQAPAAAAPAAAAAGKSAELEQRLKTLKDLKDKGLISEEVYNSKVKELLSEL
jgi:hypothetical protein